MKKSESVWGVPEKVRDSLIRILNLCGLTPVATGTSQEEIQLLICQVESYFAIPSPSEAEEVNYKCSECGDEVLYRKMFQIYVTSPSGSIQTLYVCSDCWIELQNEKKYSTFANPEIIRDRLKAIYTKMERKDWTSNKSIPEILQQIIDSLTTQKVK